MQDLLFLAHRIPYPPNKGDKIRSFNLLRHLASRYRVHLGAFIDDTQDWRYQNELKRMCTGSVKLIELESRHAKLRSLRGLLNGNALTVPYYRNREMAQWVDALMGNAHIGRVVIFSSAMAQYVEHYRDGERRIVVDFVDVDSDKWRQYAKSSQWPMRWLYAREARCLLAFDRRVAMQANASVFVSGAEAALFGRLAPECADRVVAVENGVDTAFFDPMGEYQNPYGPGEQAIVFTGAMDYWANVDAVRWFANEVFPAIRAAEPECFFYIVGSRPTTAVLQLAALPGVRVTGAVEDVRPYLRHAAFAVAPLRIARGVQNKVLEAMAMGKPVLASPSAMDGLQPFGDLKTWVAGEASAMTRLARRLLHDPDLGELGRFSREYVLQNYNWSRNLARFVSLLESDKPAMPQSTQSSSVRSSV